MEGIDGFRSKIDLTLRDCDALTEAKTERRRPPPVVHDLGRERRYKFLRNEPKLAKIDAAK
jgi:hypothetical protein